MDELCADETGLRAWRSRLCALPQRPALFAATLRENLDPENKYSDAQIFAALEQVIISPKNFNINCVTYKSYNPKV